MPGWQQCAQSSNVRLCVASRECNVHSTEVNTTHACRTYPLNIYNLPQTRSRAASHPYVQHTWTETWVKIDACLLQLTQV